jgi:hypothetical protein
VSPGRTTPGATCADEADDADEAGVASACAGAQTSVPTIALIAAFVSVRAARTRLACRRPLPRLPFSFIRASACVEDRCVAPAAHGKPMRVKQAGART